MYKQTYGSSHELQRFILRSLELFGTVVIRVLTYTSILLPDSPCSTICPAWIGGDNWLTTQETKGQTDFTFHMCHM